MKYNPDGFKINAFHLFRISTKRKTIFIFTTILFIIILISSYISSLDNLLYQVNNSRYYRLLEINIDNKLKESYILNTIRKSPYIENITPIYAYGIKGNSIEYQSNKYNGDMILYATNKDALPDIILGESFTSNSSEIVCPINYAQNKNINYWDHHQDILENDILLNKPITLEYLNAKTKEMLKEEFTIVGFYQNTNNDNKLICYGDNTKMINLMYDKQEYLNNNYLVVVDHIEHLSLVKRHFHEIGIASKEVSSFNLTYYKSIRSVVKALLIISVAIFFIIGYITLKEEYNYVIPNLGFIHDLGYPFRGIFVTYIKINTFIWLISLFLSSLSAEIYVSVFQRLIEVWPNIFGNIIIKINYPILLVVSLLFLFMINIYALINQSKIEKEKVCLPRINY